MRMIHDMRERFLVFLADQKGATAVEYGLLVALISSALIFGLGGIGNNLQAVLQTLSDTFSRATT